VNRFGIGLVRFH